MKTLFSFLALLFLSSCSSTEQLSIASSTRTCYGESEQECMIVNGQNFYNNIQGFNYEPGYGYRIIVKKSEIKNPAADASSLSYELVEVLEKTDASLLDNEMAQALVEEQWGSCGPDSCESFSVDVIQEDDKYFIQALYDGLYDDSVRAKQMTAQVYFLNDRWVFDNEPLVLYACHEGRGHEEFSPEFCL